MKLIFIEIMSFYKIVLNIIAAILLERYSNKYQNTITRVSS